MHPVAAKCIRWAVVLFVVGGALIAFAPDLMTALSRAAGANAAAGLRLADLFLTTARWTLNPLAGALIGAAVVVQTLSTEARRDDHDDDVRDDTEQEVELRP